MAQLIGLNVYQINSQQPIPLGDVAKWDFGFGQMSTVRPAGGALGVLLSTGVRVYSFIEMANGSQYYVVETPTAIAALS